MSACEFTRAAALAASLAIVTGQAHATCDTNAPPLCDPTQMQVIDLGTIGPGPSGATAINDNGQVVGDYEGADNRYHAFIDAAVAMTALPEPKGAVLTGARALNNRGQIIGVGGGLGFLL